MVIVVINSEDTKKIDLEMLWTVRTYQEKDVEKKISMIIVVINSEDTKKNNIRIEMAWMVRT